MTADPKIEELVALHLDGKLDKMGADRMIAMLKEDSRARRRFCDQVTCEASLHHLGREPWFGSSLLSFIASQPNHGRPWMSAMGAAAAVVIGLASVLWFIQVQPPDSFVTLTSSPYSVVEIRGPKGDTGPVSDIAEGSTVHVMQGAVELRLRGGVLCHLQAPAELTLLRSDLVTLGEGLARFEVEPQASGFRVRTPLLEVTDLGTVFGVDCRQPELPVVHLLKGAAEVRALTGRKEFLTLEGGESAALRAAGTLETVESVPGLFPGELPTGLPGVYFSFDEVDGEVLTGTGSLAEREQIRFSLGAVPSPRQVPGRLGAGLRLSGGDCRALSNWRSIGGSNRRSVAFWMRSEADVGPGEPTAMRILGYGMYRGGYGMANFSIRLSNDNAEQKLLLYAGRRHLEGSTRLNDGEWHHVAVIIGDPSGDEWPDTAIYIDGEVEEVTPKTDPWVRRDIEDFNTRTTHPLATPLTLGQYNPTYSHGAFKGTIDELFIVEGTLSPLQVRALYRLRPGEAGIDSTP